MNRQEAQAICDALGYEVVAFLCKPFKLTENTPITSVIINIDENTIKVITAEELEKS